MSNLDSSAAFYKKILQLKELPTPWGVNPAVRFFEIGNNRQIHMVQVDSRDFSKNKILHLAFNVKDFDKYLTFLKTQGIKYSNFSGAIGEIQARPEESGKYISRIRTKTG